MEESLWDYILPELLQRKNLIEHTSDHCNDCRKPPAATRPKKRSDNAQWSTLAGDFVHKKLLKLKSWFIPGPLLNIQLVAETKQQVHQITNENFILIYVLLSQVSDNFNLISF